MVTDKELLKLLVRLETGDPIKDHYDEEHLIIELAEALKVERFDEEVMFGEE